MSRSIGTISLAVLFVCCCFLVGDKQTVFAQLGGQLVSLVTTEANGGNTTLVSMSLPQFTIQSSQQLPFKSQYGLTSSVNRKDNLIHLFTNSILYNIDRKSLSVKQQIPINQNIVNMEYNPKTDNLVVLIKDRNYLLATVSPQNNGQINYVMEIDRMMNQSFTPVRTSYSAFDFNRNVFYMVVNDGGWIPGHNRILKFDIKNDKISAIVLEDQFSEFGDFDYDSSLDLVIGLYYPVTSDDSVDLITIDASTTKVERFSIPGTGLNSNHIVSYSSLNGYYYIMASTGKVFVIDIKARKLVLSTTNPISSKFDVMFGYYFE
ncbi:predicted protein [Naegleria gruberi]|uniref:Predicted protein n=1 Tax=Naegleria gruberi TaxID=5762 RepID=D2VCE3_NAEGR|nr:uncharacterized protein NAEGRDRAFT_66541 [Naegleria gruberi]EFC45405.1 predicted protein [Naegleria gruberi]|eukprot:XP_002678149.1 predicted protein [Naegleria gruberi strain NEG-M]